MHIHIPPHTRSRTPIAANIGRMLVLLLFGLWVARYMRETEPLLHGSLLIFHEAGHVLFMPFGEFMMVLGGSLFQLIVPAFFIGYFALRRDFFAASCAGLYLAASLAGVALYIADARAGDLPLITGDRTSHDWTFLLIEMKLLDSDVLIGRYVHAFGTLVFWASAAAGVLTAWRRVPQPATDEASIAAGEPRFSSASAGSLRDDAYPQAPRSATPPAP